MTTDYVIIGAGDIGLRIATALRSRSADSSILAISRNQESLAKFDSVDILKADLDDGIDTPISASTLFYLAPPQLDGEQDLRSQRLLSSDNLSVKRVVLISTTGVYGDHAGAWIDESTQPNPQTDRGKRRLDMERQWSNWAEQQGASLVILRVPGIYARNRLPQARLANGTPVVNPEECGFVNRIHADDLAAAALAAIDCQIPEGGVEVFNATDGTPGKISEYLQLAAKTLGLEPLPEISMQQAQELLSPAMLSYLSESRRISNQKMRTVLGVDLAYPSLKDGIKH